jgi:rsbT co-antagonist protein RsbR
MDLGYQRIPIIKLWTLLLVPLQGELTDELANQLTTEVLSRIHEDGCSGLVIDITGLWLVDSHLCAVLSELSTAASLMGARTLLSGMKPDIALTLETMGVELRGVRTTLNLEDALSALGVVGPRDEFDELGSAGEYGASLASEVQDVEGLVMDRSGSAEIQTEEQLKQHIGEFFSVLRAVDGGDLSARVPMRFAESEPMTALGTTVNAVIERLARVRTDTQRYERELEEQLTTIEKQRAAIKELSTPMIEVWAGVLCVPIVGVIDSSRAAEMTSALLSTVVEKKVRFTIIDITGIEAMDTRATDHFLRMARSVRLLGAECVLSGINPNVARSIVHMGVEMSGIETYRSLRDALQHHVRQKARAPAGTTTGGTGQGPSKADDHGGGAKQ